MKQILFLFLICCAVSTYAQPGYDGTRNNGEDSTTEHFVIQSPGNNPWNSYTTQKAKDSTFLKLMYKAIFFTNIADTVNDGQAANFLHTGPDGKVLSSPVALLVPDSNKFATKAYVSGGYYSRSQSDYRYLQSFTEADPLSWHLSDTGGVAKRPWVVSAIHDTADGLRASLVAGDLGQRNFALSLIADTAVKLRASLAGKMDNRYLPPKFDTLYGEDIQLLSGSGRTVILDRGASYTVPLQTYAETPGKPTIPTDNSQLTNGAGYLKGADTLILSARINAKQNALPGTPLYPADTVSLSNRINAKFATPTGLSTQYLNGLGNPATFPATKRIETYAGTTNVVGNYVVTFATAYSVAPVVTPSMPNQSNQNYFMQISSVTTTGFTVNVHSRSAVSTLPIVGALSTLLLGSATTPVSGVTVNVLVVEK